jgi:glyoxylase-like metal-dependent hydrolase (beta-lactamase superfamily II)
MPDDIRHVVVTHAHADYARGDLVTEPQLVEALLRDHPTKCAPIVPEKG